jgi:hypothetical protein
MIGDTRCRWGQPLGGRHDGGCDAKPMPDEMREELELTGTWCEEHGRRLAVLAVELKLRRISKRRPVPLTVVKKPKTAEERTAAYNQRRAAEALDRTITLVDEIVKYVRAADSYPVNREDVSAHFGVNGQRLTNAVNLAAERGELVSLPRSGPKLSGYWTPETAPINPTNMAETAHAA